MAIILRSLMALSLASVALATPLIATPIISRDLEIRQLAKCPGAYESANGLNFTTYCEQNNPNNDALPAFESPSMQDCMEHCSRYWGVGEGCFGVVWVENSNNCWLRTSNVTTSSLAPSTTDHSALINQGDMDPLPSSCPGEDGSLHTLDGVAGLEYTLNCNKVIDGFDACFSDYPSCLISPYNAFFHTETLEECLRECIDQHPLCKAVSWNPGLEVGFANCLLKTDFSSTRLVTPRANMGVLHSATITSIERIDTACPEKAYTAQNNKAFDIRCGQLNTGTNITHIHTQNITSCMDACASSTESCISIVFDSTLEFGFKNCALQNTTNFITTQAHATFAAVSTATSTSSASPSSSSGSSSSSSSSDSSSKAWIAGPVVGGVLAFALLGFALFWWRRRKAAKMPYVEKDGASIGGGGGGGGAAAATAYTVAPAYSPGSPPPNHQQHQQHQQYYDPPATEMSDEREHNELPASTKYSHKSATPHEMP